ncbi:MAG: hypothetical protein EZS28_036040 [Streblomastix strix]|uniref:Tyr recombinase domain-containing protein n=1 Tax=Streblomastix strix TaxID=222440 RepID=A0A5J4UDZ1_9EUKA|nr:MAG: hypothetical protein EZS28_036040 [Streblomastix strix]
MDQRDSIGTPSNSTFAKSDFKSQQRSNINNSYITVVAGPTMVYKPNESVKQVPYPWTVKLMLYQWINHEKPKKLFTTWKDSSIPHEPEADKADKRRISLWLNSILREIGIRGETMYSFKHAASSELARSELKTTKLNIFTNDRAFSRAASNQYIYAANAEINYIASQLVGIHNQSYATYTFLKQRGKEIERSDICTLPGCYLQHSGNNTLSRSSIAQPLALPFNEIPPIRPGIDSIDKTRARSDMIYFDQHDNEDKSRHKDQ